MFSSRLSTTIWFRRKSNCIRFGRVCRVLCALATPTTDNSANVYSWSGMNAKQFAEIVWQNLARNLLLIENGLVYFLLCTEQSTVSQRLTLLLIWSCSLSLATNMSCFLFYSFFSLFRLGDIPNEFRRFDGKTSTNSIFECMKSSVGQRWKHSMSKKSIHSRIIRQYNRIE